MSARTFDFDPRSTAGRKVATVRARALRVKLANRGPAHLATARDEDEAMVMLRIGERELGWGPWMLSLAVACYGMEAAS